MNKDFTTYFKQMESHAERDAYFKSRISRGRLTGYALKTKGGYDVPITFEKGLSMICAASGNGKTSFLMNLASESVNKDILEGKEKTNLFLSFEEPEWMVIASFFCRYAHNCINFNRELHHDFYGAIRAFLYDKNPEHFKNEVFAGKIAELHNEFFEKYIYSKRLIVKECRYRLEDIVNALEWANANFDLSISFLDYIQLVLPANSTGDPYRDIRYISGTLREKAIEKNLIVVSAAQLKREADKLTKITTGNIADCIDLIRDCNQVIGVGFLNIPPDGLTKKEQEFYDDIFRRHNKLSAYGLTENHIFATMLKNRYGLSNTDMLFHWSGNAKYIEPNSKLTEEDLIKIDLDDDL